MKEEQANFCMDWMQHVSKQGMQVNKQISNKGGVVAGPSQRQRVVVNFEDCTEKVKEENVWFWT